MIASAAATLSAANTADYVNPVIQATQSVFEMMLGCTPRRTGLRLKRAPEPPPEVSGVIGISGRAAGTIIVGLPRQVAFGVLERMLGTVTHEINDEVCDAVGELTNMIAGAAKAKLSQFELSISLPSVVTGEGYLMHYPKNVHPFEIEFDSELGAFSIEVAFTAV
jgi:chemotaxis protein CheX